MDFSAYIQSEWSWIVLFVMAVFVGMSKTGVQGLAILTVPLLAMTFGAKPSTGLMLPVLCFADVVGVSYYRRQAEWKYIVRLLPMAVAGFFLALWVDNMIPASEFKHLMGACLALVLAVMLWSQWRGKERLRVGELSSGMNMLTDSWWYSPLFGLLGGFTTMIGNAAGPVMAIYLLSTRMPKLAFVGTNAWFFLCVNFLKLPFQLFAWHNINLTTLAIDACAIPFVLVGAFLGIRIVKFLPERGFRIFTTAVTIISILVMLLA
ncbi:MAG: sulfite exporter TauE/SafE family protein [Prevotella sp.]|nr:sulfite exporter TauE/SafE family protein [Prevotella sp.]